MKRSIFPTFVHRIFYDAQRLLVAFLFSLPAYSLVSAVFFSFYESILSRQFPIVFPDYSPVGEPEQYDLLQARLALLAALATLFVISWLVTVYNPYKEKEIFGETFGFYRLNEGYMIYIRMYALSDIASVVAMNTVYALVSYYIPYGTSRPFNLISDLFFKIYKTVFIQADLLLGIALGIFSMLLARLPSVYFALRRYRGRMLAHNMEI